MSGPLAEIAFLHSRFCIHYSALLKPTLRLLLLYVSSASVLTRGTLVVALVCVHLLLLELFHQSNAANTATTKAHLPFVFLPLARRVPLYVYLWSVLVTDAFLRRPKTAIQVVCFQWFALPCVCVSALLLRSPCVCGRLFFHPWHLLMLLDLVSPVCIVHPSSPHSASSSSSLTTPFLPSYSVSSIVATVVVLSLASISLTHSLSPLLSLSLSFSPLESIGEMVWLTTVEPSVYPFIPSDGLTFCFASLWSCKRKSSNTTNVNGFSLLFLSHTPTGPGPVSGPTLVNNCVWHPPPTHSLHPSLQTQRNPKRKLNCVHSYFARSASASFPLETYTQTLKILSFSSPGSHLTTLCHHMTHCPLKLNSTRQCFCPSEEWKCHELLQWNTQAQWHNSDHRKACHDLSKYYFDIRSRCLLWQEYFCIHWNIKWSLEEGNVAQIISFLLLSPLHFYFTPFTLVLCPGQLTKHVY